MTWMDWRYFTPAEMACKHCGEVRMDEQFMRRLDAMRHAAGFPFFITSGYRCPVHNAAVSSTGEDGPHTTGHASDIGVSGHRALWIISNATRFGFTGIGVHQKGDSRFIHLDDLQQPWPRPAVWSY